MPGLFTVGAMAYGAKRAGDRDREELERARRREEEARLQQEEERARNEELRQIQMAQLLASLGDKGIVRNADRAQVDIGGVPTTRTMASAPRTARTAMPMPETPDLVRGSGTVATPTGEIESRVGGSEAMDVPGLPADRIADPSRYRELGNTGYSLDRQPAQIAEQRARAAAEQRVRQRMAAIRAKHPDRYGVMGDEELAGIVSDDDAYREALKDVKPPAPTAPRTITTKDGIMAWDPSGNAGAGAWKNTGMTPPPRATGTGTTPNERDALQDRIGIVTTQINQLQTALEKAPFVSSRDKSPAAEQQRAANAGIQTRLDDLRKEQASLTKELERFSGVTNQGTSVPPWAKGIKLTETGVPEGLDLSLADGATAADESQAAAALARVDDVRVTMQQLLASPYLSPAAKAIAWRRRVSAAGGTGAARGPSGR